MGYFVPNMKRGRLYLVKDEKNLIFQNAIPTFNRKNRRKVEARPGEEAH
jgi:hypothetical protein